MRLSEIIDETISKGMAKYKANEGKGGNDPAQIMNMWDAETKFVLGYVDLSGKKQGESIDFPISLIKHSAEAGFMLAQYIIGNCYDEGYGVSLDKDKALYWWQKAAEQGLDDAKEKLLDEYHAPALPAKIRISRTNQVHDIGMKYKIFINDNMMGKISRGETLEFTKPAGQYRVKAKFGWFAPETTIKLKGNETKDLIVGNGIKFSKIIWSMLLIAVPLGIFIGEIGYILGLLFMLIYFLIIKRKDYLILNESEQFNLIN